MKQTYYVYKHTFPDGKVYIGQTNRKPEERWENGNGYNEACTRKLYEDIVKIGWDNIKHEILETGLDRTQAYEAESRYIRMYDSTDPAKGYNRNVRFEAKEPKKQRVRVVPDEIQKEMIRRHFGKIPENVEEIIEAFPPTSEFGYNEDMLKTMIAHAKHLAEQRKITVDRAYYEWKSVMNMYDGFMYVLKTEGAENIKKIFKEL